MNASRMDEPLAQQIERQVLAGQRQPELVAGEFASQQHTQRIATVGPYGNSSRPFAKLPHAAVIRAAGCHAHVKGWASRGPNTAPRALADCDAAASCKACETFEHAATEGAHPPRTDNAKMLANRPLFCYHRRKLANTWEKPLKPSRGLPKHTMGATAQLIEAGGPNGSAWASIRRGLRRLARLRIWLRTSMKRRSAPCAR